MRRSRAVIHEANDKAREALQASSGRGKEAGIGALSWWDGEAGWRKGAEQVQAACRAAGLDPAATLPNPPDYAVAFGRAVQAVRASCRQKDYMLTDAADGPKGERRVAVVAVERNGRVSTTDEGTVVCPTDGTAPYVERRDPQGFAASVVSLAKDTYFERYTSDDIRTAIVEMIDRWHGMPCREQPPKVVYWIPSAALETIGKLADFAESIGWGRIEMFVGDASSDRSRKAVVTAVNQGLEGALNEFADDADKYCEGDSAKRPGALARLLEDAKALQDRWHLMRNVLGAAVKAGDSRIDKIEAKIKARMGELAAAREARAEEAAAARKSA